MASFTAGTSFTDGVANDVTAAKLNVLVTNATPTSGFIQDRTAETVIATGDTFLIGDSSDSNNLKRITVANAMKAELTGTINSTAGTIATLNGTTGTVTNFVSTTGTVATLNSTTGTIANFKSTAGTIDTLNSTTGTIATLTTGTTTSTAQIVTSGTTATLNSTTGTITNLRSTTGTIATLNSTTGTITNLSTTLAGDFAISQGTGTLGASGVAAGTYGTNTAAVRLDIDSKGRITTVSTSAISTTPADGSITPIKLSQPFTSGTAVVTTSGTAIDFTGIPSWVKRIDVIFSGVSTTGASIVLVQIGDSGGIENTSYVGVGGAIMSVAGSNTVAVAFTTGFGIINDQTSASIYNGIFTLALLSSSSWVASSSIYQSNRVGISAGSKTLSATLDRIRITTVLGTDTFDAGSINIIYQG